MREGGEGRVSTRGGIVHSAPQHALIGEGGTHGFIATLQMAWNTSAVWPVFTLTAMGTWRDNRRQYTSGCTSCRCGAQHVPVSFLTRVSQSTPRTCSARSKSDFVATNNVGMWSRLYCCWNAAMAVSH